MRGSEVALYSAIAATTIVCLLFLPRTRAFVSKVTPTRSKSSAPRLTRLPNGMPVMPDDTVKYTQVPKVGSVFTATTIPSGLLKEHNTKKGTWGLIRVLKGQLEYKIIELEKSTHVLDKDNHGIIEPTKLHQVKALTDDLEFVVEFWRVPGTGMVNEKREGLTE
ncbi:hypothetical protein ACHAWO_004831 [Cyclotella atomus]|uniref:TehB/YeaR-like domain-containing protein n=1 Tax=Cyclotella atomus TaxID=382360 RepID=A0ABD3PPJ5_9STRA